LDDKNDANTVLVCWPRGARGPVGMAEEEDEGGGRGGDNAPEEKTRGWRHRVNAGPRGGGGRTPPPPPRSVTSTLSNFATPFQSPHLNINEEDEDDNDNGEDEGRGGGNRGMAGRRPLQLRQVQPICYLGP
jgi:hypothetical protein